MSARDALAGVQAWRPTPPTAAAFVSAATLANVPIAPRAWHVADIIPAGTVTMLGGDGGVGKSIVALQLAVATAAGTSWLGRTTAGGGVLYLSAEDSRDELHRRLVDVTAADATDIADLDCLTLCSLAGEDALLAVPDPKTGVLRPTPLFAELDTRIAEERPTLVVLDTLADLHSGQENDRAVARQFIGLLRGIALHHETTVVLLAHPSLTGMSSGSGLSGSTAWNASVRSRLYLERVLEGAVEPDTNRRRLVVKKANYAPIGVEIGLTWRAGVFVPDEPSNSLDRLAVGAKAERVFLKLLHLFGEQGRRVNHGGGQNYAPTVFAVHPDAEGCSQKVLRAAMDRLLASGAVVIREDGPPSKRRSHLAVGAEK